MTSTPQQNWVGDHFHHGARYTLAQFARRAGISESYARGMHAAGDKLPRPDGTDVDGKPWWRPDTIDRWCQGTGRAVPPDAGAIYHWPKASVPAPITLQKEVMVPRSKLTDRQVPVYVTVYETDHGHLVWVQRYTGRTYERARPRERGACGRACAAAEVLAGRGDRGPRLASVPGHGHLHPVRGRLPP
ncbi:hypothetical protein [Streptomyces sp. NPDC053726]|uniref:hypothetical protein n=1 Tax=Streptomyces sp. NPDC053726 TaxID=3365713 RepID=UPI0037D033D5